jgi:hypothetical protein
MAPESCSIILFAVLLGGAYLLWLAERAPGTRLLLVVLALGFFVATIVLRNIQLARDVSSARAVVDPSRSASRP